MSDRDICANCGEYYEHHMQTTQCYADSVGRWFPKKLADALTPASGSTRDEEERCVCDGEGCEYCSAPPAVGEKPSLVEEIAAYIAQWGRSGEPGTCDHPPESFCENYGCSSFVELSKDILSKFASPSSTESQPSFEEWWNSEGDLVKWKKEPFKEIAEAAWNAAKGTK